VAVAKLLPAEAGLRRERPAESSTRVEVRSGGGLVTNRLRIGSGFPVSTTALTPSGRLPLVLPIPVARMSETRLVSTAQAAERLGYSARTVREFIRIGVLPAVRLTERGHLRFVEEDVDRLVADARKAVPS
jgi:excisionase family DNA binding protein